MTLEKIIKFNYFFLSKKKEKKMKYFLIPVLLLAAIIAIGLSNDSIFDKKYHCFSPMNGLYQGLNFSLGEHYDTTHFHIPLIESYTDWANNTMYCKGRSCTYEFPSFVVGAYNFMFQSINTFTSTVLMLGYQIFWRIIAPLLYGPLCEGFYPLFYSLFSPLKNYGPLAPLIQTIDHFFPFLNSFSFC